VSIAIRDHIQNWENGQLESDKKGILEKIRAMNQSPGEASRSDQDNMI